MGGFHTLGCSDCSRVEFVGRGRRSEEEHLVMMPCYFIAIILGDIVIGIGVTLSPTIVYSCISLSVQMLFQFYG